VIDAVHLAEDVLAGHPDRLADGIAERIVTEAETGKILGIHMIGPDSPEILQAAAIAVRAGLTKADFDATVALHPSMAEEYRDILESEYAVP